MFVYTHTHTNIYKHHFMCMYTHSYILHTHTHTLNEELVTAQPAEVLQAKAVLTVNKSYQNKISQ